MAEPNSPREAVEQHRQEKAGAEFLPGSEKVSQISGFGTGDIKTGLRLQIGVVLTKQTPNGLQIVPQHEVGFAVGGYLIPVAPSMARELGKRIAEFCDEADALNAGKVAT